LEAELVPKQDLGPTPLRFTAKDPTAVILRFDDEHPVDGNQKMVDLRRPPCEGKSNVIHQVVVGRPEVVSQDPGRPRFTRVLKCSTTCRTATTREDPNRERGKDVQQDAVALRPLCSEAGAR